MKLYFMKQSAIDYMKANMRTLYTNYYRYNTNEWIYDLFPYDPFEVFIDVPDFRLAPIGESTGEADFENCKRLYTNLRKISESQASDERLWAGLCNATFYSYLRTRWKLAQARPIDPGKDSQKIISRYFYLGGRAGKFRNTLSRCWWVGYVTYDSESPNHWKNLEIIGAEDFLSKVSELFYSNLFCANPAITRGICNGLQFYREKKQKIIVRDHLRPTVQYLNALGGGILLDGLSEDDISSIVIEYIGRIMRGEKGDFVLGQDLELEEDVDVEDVNGAEIDVVDIDYQQEQEDIESESAVIDVNEVLGKPDVVKTGCIVEVFCINRNKTQTYVIPEEDEMKTIHKAMLGKKVGEYAESVGGKYKILSIMW